MDEMQLNHAGCDELITSRDGFVHDDHYQQEEPVRLPVISNGRSDELMPRGEQQCLSLLSILSLSCCSYCCLNAFNVKGNQRSTQRCAWYPLIR